MLSELFDFVLNHYINGFKKAEKTDPYFSVLNSQFPLAIESLFPFEKELFVIGSCGDGNKTGFPWVAILNKNITQSAKKGLNIVYSFKKDMSGFYLSLNQGILKYQ